MDCLPPHGADYDNQDFYSVFIHELNETLNAPRQKRKQGSQVPLMFWTDHDCYLLMELARTSPDMIETLPKLKVASDPASTEFFYERLRTIATAAKLEAAAACCTGGNYAVIRKFSEDIAHKFPMPWHAPGWEMHCKNSSSTESNGYQTNVGPKPSLWPSMFPQQQQQRFSTKLTPSFHQASNNTSSGLTQPKIERSFSTSNLSQTPFNNEGMNGRPVEKGICDDEFMKSQDEFFLGPSSSLNSIITTCAETNFGAWAPPQQQPQHSKSTMKTENIRNYLGSSLLQTNTTMWNPNNVENTSEFASGIRYGARYWPRQQQQQSNGFDNGTGSNNKMAQQFPAYVRPNSNNNGKLTTGKNNYYCKIQNEGSDSSQSPSPPSGTSTTSKESYLCVFCKGNNEPEAIYKSHPLRLNNIVICPSLRNYTCCICKATGDTAHTIKYCPYNKRGYFATRSHEKCNSNNYSRLKMKVQILDDQGQGGQNSHHQEDYSPVRREDDEDERDCDEEDEYDDDSSFGK